MKQFKIKTTSIKDGKELYDYLFNNGIEFPFDNGVKSNNDDNDSLLKGLFHIDEGTIFYGSDDKDYGKNWKLFNYPKDKQKIINIVKKIKKYDLTKNRGLVIKVKSFYGYVKQIDKVLLI